MLRRLLRPALALVPPPPPARGALAGFARAAASAASPEPAAPPEPAAAAAAAMAEPAAPPPPGHARTFYKRALPCPPATEFSSPAGVAIFARALSAGTMAGFFRLVEQFRTQDEPAYCGLASLAMVLNALAIDPRRAWKGPWRWFHEEMLDCCLPLERVRAEGVTLAQAACLARCNGAAVELHARDDPAASIDHFRRIVRDACATGERHVIVSYSRAALRQTGDGHFSPVGGYDAAADALLVLDTARFKYPPHWVGVADMWAAMAAADGATGRARGFMLLGAARVPDSVAFTLDLRDARWPAVHAYVLRGLARAAVAEARAALARGGGGGAGGAAAAGLAAALAAAPRGVGAFVAVREAGGACPDSRCVLDRAVETLLAELRGLPLVAGAAAPAAAARAAAAACGAPACAADGGAPLPPHLAAAGGDLAAERLAALALLVPQAAWDAAFVERGGGQGGGLEGAGPADAASDAALRAELAALLDVSGAGVVAAEARYLASQLAELPEIADAAAAGAAAAAAGCGCAGARARAQECAKN